MFYQIDQIHKSIKNKKKPQDMPLIKSSSFFEFEKGTTDEGGSKWRNTLSIEMNYFQA